MRNKIRKELLDELLAGYSGPEDMTGPDGLLKRLAGALVERALAAELTDHLGHESGMLRRLHLPTVRRFYPECELRAETQDQSYRDLLATLIAEEVAHRSQTRIERSVRKARFPFLRTIEDFDFTVQTSVRLQLLGSYLGPELVSESRSLILCGPSGTGKRHLGIAVAYRAIQNGYEAVVARLVRIACPARVLTRHRS